MSTGLTAPEQVKAAVAGHEQAGCDELVLVANHVDPGQVDLLAEATGL